MAFGLAAGLFVLVGSAGAQLQIAPLDGEPNLDDVVVKGSHNSFHRHPFVAIHPRHRYDHESLSVQLAEQRVRALELDVHRSLSGEYQIYHILWIDGRTHCKRFSDCLREIREWSDANPEHQPLQIWIEAKDYAGGARISSLRPLDSLLRVVLGDRLLTPDDVRGASPSLRDALLTEGWPTLQAARGRVMFMLTADEEQVADYTSNYAHLKGRVMFVAAESHQLHLPWAGVAKINNPGDPLIATARAAGMLVTTTVCVPQLSDSDCYQARDLALMSGAQVLLDDYPHRVAGRDYHLDLDDVAIVRRGPGITGSDAHPHL